MSEEKVVEELRGLIERAAKEVAFRVNEAASVASTMVIEGLTREEWLALHDRFCPLMPKCLEQGLFHGPEERLRIIVRALKYAAGKVREEHAAGHGRGQGG